MMTTIDQQIALWFNNNFKSIDPNYTLPDTEWHYGNLILCVIAIILSVLLCGMIGLEREKRGRSAGLRTHLLVGFGSSIIMVLSIYGFPQTASFDVARLAAGVVSGVGFLGAGAIIHHEGGIKGLTTASTIWLVMAIGLCCGSMNFILAILSTAVVMTVLVSFRKIEIMVTRNNPTVVLTVRDDIPVMTILMKIAKEYNFYVSDINTQLIKNGEANAVELTFKISGTKNYLNSAEAFKAELQKETEAIAIEILNHH